jgi:hypothetical protein
MILAVDPDQPRDPRFPTQCERCRATESACEHTRLFSGRACCPSCDHHGGDDAA